MTTTVTKSDAYPDVAFPPGEYQLTKALPKRREQSRSASDQGIDQSVSQDYI